MFYTQNTENFQPDKFPEKYQAGKSGASPKIMKNSKLNGDQKTIITQIFKQEAMNMPQETTLETLPSSGYA